MYLIEIHFDDGSSRFIYPTYNTLDDALDHAHSKLYPGVKFYEVYKVERAAVVERMSYQVIAINNTNEIQEGFPKTLEGVFDFIRSCKNWTNINIRVMTDVYN